MILCHLFKPTPTNCRITHFTMSASTEGYYEKRNELKPSWVKSVELTGSAGQYAVQAGYRCSCRLTDKYLQERVGISLTRN